MNEIHYIVRKPFKYGRRRYKPGQEFEPKGGKFDDIIINSETLIAQVVKSRPDKKEAKNAT